jgi:hypothetical protein
MTHKYFSIDVFSKLPAYCKVKIGNLNYLYLFSQGSDPLMFYNFFIGKKAKEIKNMQHLFHTVDTQKYFLCLINYMNKFNLVDNEQAMAYLYGNICHYYLDMMIHPYIFYKTGLFNKKDKNTYKYNCLHQKMEYSIDKYLIEKREKINSKDFKIHKNIFKYEDINNEVIKMIDYIINDTYDIKNISKYYIKSIKDMETFFRLFNYDKYGIKKFAYSIINCFTPRSFPNVRVLSFNDNFDEKYLNLEKKKWYHPCNKLESYNYSFFDLYDMALDKSIDSIILVTKMLDTKRVDKKTIKKLFDNSSYVTGINCKAGENFRFFEF